jgi:hypothetical protein
VTDETAVRPWSDAFMIKLTKTLCCAQVAMSFHTCTLCVHMMADSTGISVNMTPANRGLYVLLTGLCSVPAALPDIVLDLVNDKHAAPQE